MLLSEMSAYNRRIQRLRTHDALLTAETPESTEANARRVERLTGYDPGLVSTGDPADMARWASRVVAATRSVLERLPAADARRLAARLQDELEPYAGIERAGGWAVSPENGASTASPEELGQDAHRTHLSRDARSTMKTIAQIQAANERKREEDRRFRADMLRR